MTWPQLAATKQFADLSDEDKQAVREQYFHDVVAPHVEKTNVDVVRSQFMDDTAPYMYSRLESGTSSFVHGAANVISSVPKAIGEVATGLANQFGDNPILGNPEHLQPEDTASYQVGQAIDDWVANNFTVNPSYNQEFLTSTLPSGAGSTLGFAAGGLAGRVMKVPELLTTATLGATAEGVSNVEDYKRHMADQGKPLDENDRFKTFLASIPGGASEAVPISRAFSRLDKMTGGSLQKGLAEVGKGAAEEFIQEWFQQVADNYVASDVVKYDPNRGLFDSATEAGAAGGIIGALMNTVAVALGARHARPAEARPAPEAKPETKPAQLEHNPEARIVFPDGSVAYRSEIEDQIAQLETAGKAEDAAALRTRLMGYDAERERTANQPFNFSAPGQAQVGPAPTQVPVTRFQQPGGEIGKQLESSAVQQAREEALVAQADAARRAGFQQADQARQAELDAIYAASQQNQERPTAMAEAFSAAKQKPLSAMERKKLVSALERSLKTDFGTGTVGAEIGRPQPQIPVNVGALTHAEQITKTEADNGGSVPRSEVLQESGHPAISGVRVQPGGQSESGQGQEVQSQPVAAQSLQKTPQAAETVKETVPRGTTPIDDALAKYRDTSKTRYLNYLRGLVGKDQFEKIRPAAEQRWNERASAVPAEQQEATPIALPAEQAQPVAAVSGGTTVTPQAPAQPPKAVAKPSRAKTIDAAKDDLLAAIAKAGGISRDAAKAQGIDPAEFTRRGHGISYVFTKGGDSLDGMAERLAQYGYPVTNEKGQYEANKLLDQIHNALGGKRINTPTGTERQLAEQDAFSAHVPQEKAKALAELAEKASATPNEQAIAEARAIAVAKVGTKKADEIIERTAIQSEGLSDEEYEQNVIRALTEAAPDNAGNAQGVHDGANSRADVAGEKETAGSGSQIRGREEQSKRATQVLDAGEKIGGARKDRWAERGLRESDLEGMTGGEEAQYVTKDHIWPKPDYAKLIEDGMTPKAAALMKLVRDRLAAKPSRDSSTSRREYLEAMTVVADHAKAIKTQEDIRTWFDNIRSSLGVKHGITAYSGEEARAALKKLWSVYKGRADPFQIGWKDQKRADLLLGEGWPTKKASTSISTKQKDTKKLPSRPHLDEITRQGKDRRDGADVTSEKFIKTFGFRGVEYGNWAAQDERQRIVNLAYDALHDLAEVLKLPPKALSLNGSLGVAFGARGSGKALAHYEPGKLVINMTKLRGAGSLAHEWGHALDHYFGELDRADAYGGKARGASGWYERMYGSRRRENMRPEMAAAFEKVMDAIFDRNRTKAEEVRRIELGIELNEGILTSYHEKPDRYDADSMKTLAEHVAQQKERLANITNQPEPAGGYGKIESSYYKQAQLLSGQSGKSGYWARPTEMFARAFESYVFDEIRNESRQSDYLVHGVEGDRYDSMYYKGNPYPKGMERETINAAFDRLFETMQTKETDKGVALFSRGKGSGQPGISTSEVHSAIVSAINGWKHIPAGIKIIETVDELPRVLRDYVYRVGAENETKGLFEPKTNRVYLVSSNIKSDADAQTALLHEVVGHFGLRRTLPRAQIIPLLNRIATERSGDVARIAKDYGLNLNTETGRLTAAEEWLANTAEKGDQSSFLDRAVSMLRQWVRKYFQSLKFSEREARGLIGRMARNVTGKPSPKPSYRDQMDEAPAYFKRSKDASPAESDKQFQMPEVGQIKAAWENFVFKAQDRFNALKAVQQEAEKRQGRPLSEDADPYMAQIRYSGMVGARVEDFNQDHVSPLIKAIHDKSLSLEEVEQYLLARHAPEANAHLERINEKQNGDISALSGMSNDQAAKTMADFQKAGKIEALQEIAKRVDAITKFQRELLVESGLETAETIKKWEQTYKHYVPTHRDLGESGDMPVKGRGLSSRGGTKRRSGSQKEVVDILPYIVAQTEQTIIRAEKAKVGAAVLKFVEKNPNKNLWEVDKVTHSPTFNKDGLVTYRQDPKFSLSDNVFSVRVNGEDHYITFNAHNVYSARIVHSLNNLSASDMGALVRGMYKLNRVLSFMSTSANPEFLVSNLARDLQTAAYNLKGTEAHKLTTQVMKDVKKAWSGLRASQKGDYSSEWAKYAREFRDQGGRTGWLDTYKDIKDRRRSLEKDLKLLNSSVSSKIKRGLLSVEKFIEDQNNAVENAVRLSTYVNARKAGISQAKAAVLSKELTVNFNKRGDAGVAMNAMYLFYNASIQGTARMLSAVKSSPRVRKMVVGTILFAATMDYINRIAGGDDKDGVPYYDKIGEYTKSRNMIIMLDKGDYIKIPLPWGYNVFHVLGQSLVEPFTQKHYKATEAAWRIIGSIVDAFNPVGGGTLLQTLSPTIADPFVQWAENKDFAGRPLRPSDNPFDVEKPDSQKYFNSVRPMSKWVAEKLNELTGGDKVRSGALDFSPEAFDLLIDTFGGGATRFVTDAINTPINAFNGEKIESYTVPGLRRVYGSVPERQALADMYQNLDAIRLTKEQLDAYKGDSAKTADIRREYALDVKMMAAAKVVQSQMHKLNKVIRQTEAGSLSEAEKKAKVQQLEDRKIKLAQEFNRRYNLAASALAQ